MNSYLKQFTIVLETLSPIHIGDGDKYEKNNYIAEQNDVFVFRGKRFYRFLEKRYPKSGYDAFVSDRRYDLKKFFYDYRIPKNCYPEAMERMIKIAAPQRSWEQREIFTFIRDPYGCPYIPGSSFKGALRSVIEGALILRLGHPVYTEEQMIRTIQEERAVAREKGKNLSPKDKSFLKKPNEKLKNEMLHADLFPDNTGAYKREDILNDIMRAVIVGDSEPLSDEDILINSVFSLGADNFEWKDPTVYAECLKPHTIVRFPIILDLSLCEKMSPSQRVIFSPDGILKAIEVSWDNYVKKYIGAYSRLDKGEHGSILMLGKYSGFVSKTMETALLGEREASRVIAEVLDEETAKRKQYFVRCSYVGEEIYQIGRCRVSIE